MDLNLANSATTAYKPSAEPSTSRAGNAKTDNSQIAFSQHFEHMQAVNNLRLAISDSKVRTQTGTASAVLRSADSNQDGSVSRRELNDCIDQMNQRIADKSDSQNGHCKGKELIQLVRNSIFAQQLLGCFDSVANLDGKAGISECDINKLAAEHGNSSIISSRDFEKAMNSGDCHNRSNTPTQTSQSSSSNPSGSSSHCSSQNNQNVFSLTAIHKLEELLALIQKNQQAQECDHDSDNTDNSEEKTDDLPPKGHHQHEGHHKHVSRHDRKDVSHCEHSDKVSNTEHHHHRHSSRDSTENNASSVVAVS